MKLVPGKRLVLDVRSVRHLMAEMDIPNVGKLGERLDINPRQMRSYLNGNLNITVRVLTQMGNVLGVNPIELLRWE